MNWSADDNEEYYAETKKPKKTISEKLAFYDRELLRSVIQASNSSFKENIPVPPSLNQPND